VLIVIGLGVLVWGFTRLGGEKAPEPVAAVPEPTGDAEAWAAAIPAGATVRSISLGSDGRLAVHVAGPAGEEILIVNRYHRVVEQRIRLRPEADGGARP